MTQHSADNKKTSWWSRRSRRLVVSAMVCVGCTILSNTFSYNVSVLASEAGSLVVMALVVLSILTAMWFVIELIALVIVSLARRLHGKP